MSLVRGLIVTLLLAALGAVTVPLMRGRTGPAPRERAEALRTALGLAGVPLALVVGGAALWVALVAELVLGLFALVGTVILETPAAAATGDWRFRLAQVAALTAVLGAVLVLPVTLTRLRLAREQTRTAEETLFNEKITEAASGLYAQRQVTRRYADGRVRDEYEDDVVRRNAAIDRLEGLVAERPDTAERVARLLSVYVRELSREVPPVAAPKGADTATLGAWARELRPARSDMENAAKVLGGLSATAGVATADLPIDLRDANLQAFDLSNVDLQGANLWRAQLHGANLFGAQVQGAKLTGAKLLGANLWGAELQGAKLWDAQLQGANLRVAQLQGAKLWHAQLQGAELWDAQLQGANLEGAEFDRLTGLRVATLRGAALRKVDLTNVPEIAPHLSDVFGDGSVTLPDTLDPATDWPDHWRKDKLDPQDFRKAWRAWQRARGWNDLIPYGE